LAIRIIDIAIFVKDLFRSPAVKMRRCGDLCAYRVGRKEKPDRLG